MQKDLNESIVDFCSLLDKFSVRYMVVGGTAVALHGFYRASVDWTGKLSLKPDLDCWYEPTYSNYFKLLDVLEHLGLDTQSLRAEQSPNPKKSFFRYDLPALTLDLLPIIKADIPFREAYRRRYNFLAGTAPISVIAYDDLIADKKATNRPKDLIDIAELEQRKSK